MDTRTKAKANASSEPLASSSSRVKEVVQSTMEFAREQRWRSWWHLWSTLAATAAIFTMTALSLPWPVRAILSCMAGLILVRMFILYHDFKHGTILRGSRLARAIMFTYGILTLNPPSSWKRSHNHHHKNNAKIFGASIGSFPVMTTGAYARATRLERFGYALSRHPLTILCAYATVFLYGMCLKPLWQEKKDRFDCALALALQLCIIVTLAILAPGILLFSFAVPMASAAALGAYLFYSQHNFPGVKLKARAEWDFVYAAIHSSSYTAMGPVMRWFTGNIGYHHVHHLNAHIPFYRLPEAMSRIRELQDPKTIRLNLSDICLCFRLKLWDPVKERMVPFRGV